MTRKPNKFSLTPAQFAVIRSYMEKRPNAKGHNIEASYGRWVEGKSVIELTTEFKLTRQALYRATNVVLELYEEHRAEVDAVNDDAAAMAHEVAEVRPTWVKVSAVLPPGMARVVKEMEKAALEDFGSAQIEGDRT